MARISYIGDSGEPLELVVGADNPEVMIGRHRSCAIRTSTQSVSRHHARVYFDGQSYWLQDNGSSNGSFYQNQRLTPQEPVSIADGEFFMCGNFEMRFDLDEEDLAMLASAGESAFDDTMDDVLVEYEDDAVPEATAFVDLADHDEAPDAPAFSEEDEWEDDDVPPPPTSGRDKAPIPPPPGVDTAIPMPPDADTADDDFDEIDDFEQLDDFEDMPGEEPAPPTAASGNAADAQMIEDLRASLDARTREVENQDSKIQGLEIELESLSNRIEEVGGAEGLGDLMTEVDELRPLRAEVETLRTELAAASEGGGTDQAEVDDLRTAIESHNTEIQTRDGEIEALNSDLATTKAQLEEAKAAAEALNVGAADPAKVDGLEREVEELSDEVKHAKEKYEEARAGRRNAEELASLLRTQSETSKAAAEAAKADVARLTTELASAGSAGSGDDAAVQAAKAQVDAAEQASAALQSEVEALKVQLASKPAQVDAADVDLREVAELEQLVKEKDDEIARLCSQVEEAKAGAGEAEADPAELEAVRSEAAAAKQEAEDLRSQLADSGAAAGELADVNEKLQNALAENDDLSHAAGANMKRMKKLMKELEEARAAAEGGGKGGGDDGAVVEALTSEIELLKKELSAAEKARDDALVAAQAGDGSGSGDASIAAAVGDLNGVVSSFRTDFMGVVDAFELIRSKDESDRSDGMEQMQEGLDACQGRAGELKSMVRSLKSAVE